MILIVFVHHGMIKVSLSFVALRSMPPTNRRQPRRINMRLTATPIAASVSCRQHEKPRTVPMRRRSPAPSRNRAALKTFLPLPEILSHRSFPIAVEYVREGDFAKDFLPAVQNLDSPASILPPATSYPGCIHLNNRWEANR